jgi:hypothetical protein
VSDRPGDGRDLGTVDGRLRAAGYRRASLTASRAWKESSFLGQSRAAQLHYRHCTVVCPRWRSEPSGPAGRTGSTGTDSSRYRPAWGRLNGSRSDVGRREQRHERKHHSDARDRGSQSQAEPPFSLSPLTASGVRNRIPNMREGVAVRRVYFCRDRAVPPNAGARFVSRLVGGAPGENHRHETRKQQGSHLSTPFLQRLSVVTRHLFEVARRVVRRRGLPEAGLKHGSLPKPRAEKARPVLTTATELKMGVAQHARTRCPAWLAVLELLSHHMSHELCREPRVRSHAGVPLVILPQ